MQARYDVAIIGAGRAGLACACLASAAGMRVAVVDKEPEEVLPAPPSDGRDIGSESVLQTYDSEHRKATFPLYVAANALVGLYTDNGALAQLARNALLKIGKGFSPIKDFMLHKLTELDDTRALV